MHITATTSGGSQWFVILAPEISTLFFLLLYAQRARAYTHTQFKNSVNRFSKRKHIKESNNCLKNKVPRKRRMEIVTIFLSRP